MLEICQMTSWVGSRAVLIQYPALQFPRGCRQARKGVSIIIKGQTWVLLLHYAMKYSTGWSANYSTSLIKEIRVEFTQVNAASSLKFQQCAVLFSYGITVSVNQTSLLKKWFCQKIRRQITLVMKILVFGIIYNWPYNLSKNPWSWYCPRSWWSLI